VVSYGFFVYLRVEFSIESRVFFSFFCYPMALFVMKPENPYSASRPGMRLKPDTILVFPFSRQKTLLKICTTQQYVGEILFLKEQLGS